MDKAYYERCTKLIAALKESVSKRDDIHVRSKTAILVYLGRAELAAKNPIKK